MTPIDSLDLEENILARLDRDATRGRYVFRLIDTDAGQTITTRIFTNEAQALHYFAGWRDPYRGPVSVAL